MEVRHRVSFNSKRDKKLFEFIKASGLEHTALDLPGGHSQLISLDINESNPYWMELSRLVKLEIAVDIWDTYFSQEEVLNAEWVRMLSTYEEGYPQPMDTWVKNPNNYINNCNQCGSFQQVSSFQLKKEPSLRGRDFMTLFWAPLAFFCTPRVLSTFKAHNIRGYEPWDVMLYKSQEPAQRIFQLWVANETLPGLIHGETLDPTQCKDCNITRHAYHAIGVMQYRRDAFDPALDIVKSHEWFGNIKDAYKEVFVSQRFAKLVYEQGWKGVRFKVVNLV